MHVGPTPPSLSHEQRVEASRLAVANRRRRAEVKRMVKSGDLSLEELFELAKHEECVAQMRAHDLISALPAIGEVKAERIMTKASIASNPDFFKQLIDQGSYAEDHTLSHDVNMVKDQDYNQQKAEICGMADYELAHFGRRPTLFRPPGGAYSDITRQAAADCGMQAVVTWIAKANGGEMQYQVGGKLRAGDVVLMHFRPEFKDDMKAFVDAMKVSGLHTALLEDAL